MANNGAAIGTNTDNTMVITTSSKTVIGDLRKLDSDINLPRFQFINITLNKPGE